MVCGLCLLYWYEGNDNVFGWIKTQIKSPTQIHAIIPNETRIDGLVQERCNSSTLASSYVFLAPTHRYGLLILRKNNNHEYIF